MEENNNTGLVENKTDMIVDNHKKSNNKGLKIIAIILALLIVGILLYMLLDKTIFNKNTENNISQESNAITNNTTNDNNTSNTNTNTTDNNTNTSSETLITTYKFDLSKVSCTNQTTSTCVKTVKVGLNGANHAIKIEALDQSVAGQTNHDGEKYNEGASKLVYKIYMDDKLVHTLDLNMIYDAIAAGNKVDNTALNFYGYLYIIDGKNFAIVHPEYSLDKLSRYVSFYTGEGKYLESLKVKDAWRDIITSNGKALDDVSNIEFDGHTLKVWDLNCNQTSQAVQKHITITNGSVSVTSGKTIDNIQVGGGEPGCKIQS